MEYQSKGKQEQPCWEPPKIEILIDKEDIAETLGPCSTGMIPSPLCPISTCSSGAE